MSVIVFNIILVGLIIILLTVLITVVVIDKIDRNKDKKRMRELEVDVARVTGNLLTAKREIELLREFYEDNH